MQPPHTPVTFWRFQATCRVGHGIPIPRLGMGKEKSYNGRSSVTRVLTMEFGRRRKQTRMRDRPTATRKVWSNKAAAIVGNCADVGDIASAKTGSMDPDFERVKG